MVVRICFEAFYRVKLLDLPWARVGDSARQSRA